MASLVIPSGLTYVQKDLLYQFFTPLFIDNPILNEQFTVIPDVKTSRELLKISALDKITKGYQRGTSFTSSTGVVITPDPDGLADEGTGGTDHRRVLGLGPPSAR